jgi:hypothetical protein
MCNTRSVLKKGRYYLHRWPNFNIFGESFVLYTGWGLGFQVVDCKFQERTYTIWEPACLHKSTPKVPILRIWDEREFWWIRRYCIDKLKHRKMVSLIRSFGNILVTLADACLIIYLWNIHLRPCLNCGIRH